MSDLQQFDQCLICLNGNKTMFSLQEVLTEFDGFSVAETLEHLSLLKFSDSAHLCRSLCFKCVAKIQTCFEFKTQCSHIEASLKTRTENIFHGLSRNSFKQESIDLSDVENFSEHISDDVVSYSENETVNYIEEINTCEDDTDIEIDEGIFSITNDPITDMLAIENVSTGAPEKFERLCCPICNRQFRYNITLNKHMEQHSIDNISKTQYKCSNCNQKFCTAEKLRIHEASHVETSKIKCTICQMIFNQEIDLKKHLKIHTIKSEPQETTHTSGRCLRLRQHKVEYSEEKILKVELNEKKKFGHRNMKNGKKNLTCVYCHKKFHDKKVLKQHMRTHTGEKPHTCDICDKSFAWANSYYRHRRIHLKEKPFVCKICGKSFRRTGDLKRHKATHSMLD